MEKFTKKFPISSLKEGDKIEDIFIVKFKRGVSQYARGYAITLVLMDSSGKSLEYKYWGENDEKKVKDMYDSIKQDSVVLFNGTVSNYKGKLQLASDSFSGKIIPLTPNQYEQSEFIPSARKEIDIMYVKLTEKIDSIKDDSLRNLVREVFNEIGDKFKKHPAAIQIHHNWVGGLLEHTLETIDYCETSAKLYSELNRDLLLAGAVLHDVGKLEELEVTSRIKGSQKGQLMGHLILGMNYLNEKLKESKLNELTKNKLLHLLVSNHGKLEFGSPKEPMIPEALALYYADELSSKIVEMIEFIKDNKESTEDDFMYHNKKGINIFLR